MKYNVLGKKIKDARKALNLSQEEVATKLGYTDRSTIAKIEAGHSDLTQHKIEKFAEALNVSPAYLMGWENDPKGENKTTNTDVFQFTNIKPIATKKIPMLGEIACGKPIFANQEYDEYIEVGHGIKVDFALKAKGDSMIDACIKDGDIVFCKSQNIVNNGEIGVVIIDDEATLKRVYYYPDKQRLVLQPENKKYEPLVYVGEELETIRIIGKAVTLKLN